MFPQLSAPYRSRVGSPLSRAQDPTATNPATNSPARRQPTKNYDRSYSNFQLAHVNGCQQCTIFLFEGTSNSFEVLSTCVWVLLWRSLFLSHCVYVCLCVYVCVWQHYHDPNAFHIQMLSTFCHSACAWCSGNHQLRISMQHIRDAAVQTVPKISRNSTSVQCRFRPSGDTNCVSWSCLLQDCEQSGKNKRCGKSQVSKKTLLEYRCCHTVLSHACCHVQSNPWRS